MGGVWPKVAKVTRVFSRMLLAGQEFQVQVSCTTMTSRKPLKRRVVRVVNEDDERGTSSRSFVGRSSSGKGSMVASNSVAASRSSMSGLRSCLAGSRSTMVTSRSSVTGTSKSSGGVGFVDSSSKSSKSSVHGTPRKRGRPPKESGKGQGMNSFAGCSSAVQEGEEETEEEVKSKRV